MTGVAVGVDVGGTHLRAATIDAAGVRGGVHRERSRTTDAAVLVADVAAAAAAVDPSGRLPLGVGMAGLCDRAGRFLAGPNVGVTDVPLAADLGAATGRRVVVVNDATAAAVAEHRLGAGVGRDDLVVLTLGTGVGGGIIAGGRALLGAHGFAAELGHVIVADGGRPAPSGIAGTLEGYASGEAVARAAAAAAPRGGAGARAVRSEDVVAAAADAAPWAIELLADAGRWLGVAVASLVNALDPAVVLVGGGFGTAAAPWLLPAARAAAAERVLTGPGRPVVPVLPAALGDDAGLIGAALLALDAEAA